jgi:hypothetical protein
MDGCADSCANQRTRLETARKGMDVEDSMAKGLIFGVRWTGEELRHVDGFEGPSPKERNNRNAKLRAHNTTAVIRSKLSLVRRHWKYCKCFLAHEK